MAYRGFRKLRNMQPGMEAPVQPGMFGEGMSTPPPWMKRPGFNMILPGGQPGGGAVQPPDMAHQGLFAKIKQMGGMAPPGMEGGPFPSMGEQAPEAEGYGAAGGGMKRIREMLLARIGDGTGFWGGGSAGRMRGGPTMGSPGGGITQWGPGGGPERMAAVPGQGGRFGKLGFNFSLGGMRPPTAPGLERDSGKI